MRAAICTGLLAPALLFSWVVFGAPTTTEQVKPPPADAAAPSSTTGAATPPASKVPADKPVSGGGDGPHGAMKLEAQQAALDKLVKPSVGVPPGIDPAYWKVLVPADNAQSDARIAL